MYSFTSILYISVLYIASVSAALVGGQGKARFAAPGAAFDALRSSGDGGVNAASERAIPFRARELNESSAAAAAAARSLAEWGEQWIAGCVGSSDDVCASSSAALVAVGEVSAAARRIADRATQISSDAGGLVEPLREARLQLWNSVATLASLAELDLEANVVDEKHADTVLVPSACISIRDRADATMNALCRDGITASAGLVVSLAVLAVLLLVLAVATNRMRTFCAHIAVHMVVEEGAWADTHGGLDGEEREYVNAFLRDEALTTMMAATLACLVATKAANDAHAATVGLIALPLSEAAPAEKRTTFFDWLKRIFRRGAETGVASASVRPDDTEMQTMVSQQHHQQHQQSVGEEVFQFDAVDLDGDGRVDESELAAALAAAVGASNDLSLSPRDDVVVISADGSKLLSSGNELSPPHTAGGLAANRLSQDMLAWALSLADGEKILTPSNSGSGGSTSRIDIDSDDASR